MKQENNSPLKVTYIGGPTVIIEIGNFKIMTDPTLDPEGTTVESKLLVEKKLSGPALIPHQYIDAVLLSHDQHFDNLDNSGREFLKKVGITLTTVEGAERLKGNAKGLEVNNYHTFETADGNSVKITATPARHGPAGVEKITGHVIGFHIAVSGNQSFEVYITGDTVYYNKIEELATKIKPQYIFVHGGAVRPHGAFHITMSTNDVVDTAALFPGVPLIPLHTEGWTHYTEHNATLIEAFEMLGIKDRLHILEPGKLTELPLN
ncbi:MAG: MBL fold metallo-hydrolase [Mucilaginibacter sp.]|uniref:MBL fold metallo-hydrolase n=1 Tax=Mucilaginibacter sp. TaxID=1882438 RepID=UPI0031A7EB22